MKIFHGIRKNLQPYRRYILLLQYIMSSSNTNAAPQINSEKEPPILPKADDEAPHGSYWSTSCNRLDVKYCNAAYLRGWNDNLGRCIIDLKGRQLPQPFHCTRASVALPSPEPTGPPHGEPKVLIYIPLNHLTIQAYWEG